MKTEAILRNWAVVGGSPYTAPECVVPRLKGNVFGHPEHKDGNRITTTHIRSAVGRRIETRNTIYTLDGPPDPAYVAWCQEHGVELPDEANPIRVRRTAS